MRLLGKDVPVMEGEDGTVLAASDGKPGPAAPVRAYLTRAFGNRRDEAQKAMEALAPQPFRPTN
jgi:hypothetical protein